MRHHQISKHMISQDYVPQLLSKRSIYIIFHMQRNPLACQITKRSTKSEINHFLKWGSQQEFSKLALEQVDMLLPHTIYLHRDERYHCLGNDFIMACNMLSYRRKTILDQEKLKEKPEETTLTEAPSPTFFREVIDKVRTFFGGLLESGDKSRDQIHEIDRALLE